MGQAPLVGGQKAFHRPFGVAIVAIIMILVGVVVMLLGLVGLLFATALGFFVAGPLGAALGAAIGIVVIVLGAIALAAGLGMWRMRGWAWWLAALVVLLMVVAAFPEPVSTAITGLFFVYLVLVKKHFNQ